MLGTGFGNGSGPENEMGWEGQSRDRIENGGDHGNHTK